MRTWLWVLSALLAPISADVLCDVRMSERTVMLINTKTGDEKYTASTLELECNDVYKKDGETVRSPWPLWLKKCRQWGQFYNQLTDSCGSCPDASGQSPQEAFPDLNLPDDSWFRQCIPMPSPTGMVCMCSYEYNGQDDMGNYNWGSGTHTASITDGCKASDDGCMEFVSSQMAWSVQPWMLKLPSYTCTGLPPFAPSGDISSSMMTPPLEKDSLYQLLRNSFADGVDTHQNIMKDWQLKENSVKILFMSRISKSGQDLSVGPSLAELASNCQININVYFDTQGTAVNNGESVPASAIPTYSPLCVADEVNHMKEFIANITGEMSALANNNVTCNGSKSDGATAGGGYRRLSKRDQEVEKLLRSWEEMTRSQGRASPSILGQMQLKKEAQRVVAARQAKEWKRKLQEETEHYVVIGHVRLWMQDSCESFASLGDLSAETVGGFYLPLLEHAIGADAVAQYGDKWKIEANECKAFELADGTTSGSSIFMRFTGDAGPVQGGDDSLQTAWYNALLSAGSDASLFTSAVTEPVAANFKETTGMTVTGLIIPDVNDASSMFYGGEVAWSVEATTMSFQPGACEQHCFEKMCEEMSCDEKYKCMDCASDAMCSSPSTEGCDGTTETGTGGTGGTGGTTGSTGGDEGHYMVKGTILFWTSDSCETLGQNLAQLSPDVLGGLFAPVLMSAMGEEFLVQYGDRVSVPAPECKPTELPDGTTSGSSIFVQYALDAKSDKQLQQDWYDTIKAATSAYDKYGDIEKAVKANFLALTSYEPTDFTLWYDESAAEPMTWGVQLADGSVGGSCDDMCYQESCEAMDCFSKEKCKECGSDAMCHSPSFEGCDSTGGNGYGGTGGTGGYGSSDGSGKGGYGDNGGPQQEAWWELKEGMRCEQKRQIIEERSQRLLQHAFVITGKDSWAGCKGFLDSWVVYGTQTKTKTTNKCTVPYEDNTGAVNPAWEKDPCCNWVKRQEQCCGPRSVEEKITVVDDVNESNIALFSAATDSGTLALDLAMTYASSETEAAKSCFGPFKDFMDATSDVWKVVDDCRTAVEGAWSETFQVQLGAKCTSNIDCYTGECYIPVSSNKGGGSGGSSGGQKQKYCKTPDAMVVPNWGTATLTCLIDKSIPELKGRLAIRLKMPGSSTPAELASKFLAEPGMQRSECRGQDNPWNRHTEEECMAPKQCNYDRSISNETECLNPCEDGDVSCSSYCGQGDYEVSELPFCLPRVQDGGDPWSACHTYVYQKRQEWEMECQQCMEQCNNIDWSDPEAEPCNCYEPDGVCDYWRREKDAEKECMNDYCGRYCSGGECASLYRWQCIYAGFSFLSSRKEECLSECSAAGGPNPIPPKNCRAVLNPSTATEDACWKLGQGWIELHYLDLPNWDWGRGNPPPESCVIKSYEVLNGKPYVPPPPYGPTCLPECESELDSCIDNPNCYSLLEAEGKQVFQICEERFELFRESYESCLEQQRNGCSGVGCMRIYRACRISTGLEFDPIFKDNRCGGCDGWWSNRASRELQCAEELSVEQCRWNVTTQSTESQPCARECIWEICDQAFAECQIAGGSLAECNNQTISMNQCRECNFIHCEDRCNQGACDVIFGSRDEAYRSCAGCDTSAQCNPSSPCYGDSADSSCNWRWAPEFGYSCSILCEESLRMCQEGVRGFCWSADDTGVSRGDACHMEYDMYRADMDACWQANFPTTLPDGAIWREIEIATTMTCAAQHLPQDWDCLKCDGEWNSWVVWSADLGPKCIAGSVSFDNGKTVPDTCSNCKPRTCPQYPVNCEARWYDQRQCHWNEYNFKICSKSDAEAKAAVVAANAECADCQTARCEWSCYDHTCAELMLNMPWDRMAPVEQCSGCPDVARCHPGADCFISDVVAFTQSDLDNWDQFLTLFQPMMDQYVQCTGMPLQRRLKVAETKTPQAQPTKPRPATKAQRPSQLLRDLESKVTNLWRQGNRLRNEGRNKRYQLKQLAAQKVGRTNFQGVLARRNLVEKQHQELQKRYLTLVQNHGEALEKWQKEGGVASAPPHHPMSAFNQELRTVGSSSSRRLKDEAPQQVQLACTGTNCATQSDLCTAFFNRGGAAQQLVDTLVTSFSYDLLPWESGDEICQHMGEICYMSLDAAETAVLQGVYDDIFRPPWVESWCDGMGDDWINQCDVSTMCSSCSDLTTDLNYETCDGCCRCFADTTGYYAQLKHSWSIPEQKCSMLGNYLRNSGKDLWVHYDEKLLGGAGACSTHLNVWDMFHIPDECHHPECYQNEECAKQCVPPEVSKEMCPSPFTWSFFKSTREWRPGMLVTQSSCEEKSCFPQPWIPTEEECKTVSHCNSDCPYCETDQYWNWEVKKTMVKCSLVSSKTSKPLVEADCKIACGGSFTDSCYFKKDNRSTAAACITDPPTDALGSTTYEKCVGQKALTGASVSSANYELLQCSSFTTEQCGWAKTTFGSDMACSIHRLQCKNKADCKGAGRCDYEWDDWQIQENGGLCVAPTDFSKDTSYSPHRDFWSECYSLGGEHRSYGCMLYEKKTKDDCTQAGAKWFPSAHSMSKCEVPGYAWKKMSTGGFYSGTMACCIQLRGSKTHGRCEMFTQDENSTSCEHCGGTWMSIFKFRSHGEWLEGSWQKNYKWTARAFEPSNKWVTRIAFEKVTDVWQILIAAIRAVPAVNFVTCRINPTLDTLVAIAKQTAAQSTLGTVPLLPATASATRMGDYVIEPFDNSVTGTSEIDVQVNLLSSGAVVAENAAGDNSSTGGGNRRQRRLAGTGLSDTLTASCYTVVQNAGRYIGQLVGDCIIFNPSTPLDNPVSVCLPTSPQIPVYAAFNLDCLVTVDSGVYTVAPMTVTKSSDGLSTCASLSASGTYCPGKIFGTGEPDRSAPSGCGSVTAISDTVTTQAAVLKAAGPVSLPGLVKIGETVSSDGYAPQAVYISSSGTVKSVEDFAETAQQITGTNAGGASTTITTLATTVDENATTTEGEGTTSLDGRESSSTIKLSSSSCLPASITVAALLQLLM